VTDVALRYLYEAAITGSMRAAADKIGVAVSSVSRQIAQLELTLGVPLIERGRRVIRLTEAGRLAADRYQEQLAGNDAFMARLADLRGVRSGSVDIAVGEGFLGQVFTSFIDEFQQRNPLIRIGIHMGSTGEVIRRVVADESHIGLVMQVPSEPKIRIRASTVQPLTVIVAPGHPLASHAAVTLEELARHSLCLAPKEFRIRQILAAVEARQHIFLDPEMTTNSVLVMRDAARTGRFATVLQGFPTLTELREGLLVSVPLREEGLEDTTIGLVSRAARQLEGAPLRMLTALEARLRSWTKLPPAEPGAS